MPSFEQRRAPLELIRALKVECRRLEPFATLVEEEICITRVDLDKAIPGGCKAIEDVKQSLAAMQSILALAEAKLK